ncbi:hypothetical protein HU200_045827 [Digitaria exilis]|uniref:At1g61320/AtMIF1 LRR domain-containing protein n=1 Tax=Digitaria exilis TaxID=1010633 RepID=A0A835AXZ6_9POAL|nr:hypothetical protein HU200_045827 [Digitaria exilis]
MLTDDILLSILGVVDITTAARTGILSSRWKHLPWLLRELTIDCKDFLSVPHPNPIEDDEIHKSMSSVKEAVRSMMARTRRKSSITKLSISLFFSHIYSNDIGDIVNEAVENGMVKDIELISGEERFPYDVPDDEMAKHADDLHNLFAHTCTELRYLYFYQCDIGINTLFKIDAPNSKLNVLEFAYCAWNRVEVVCLPKLEQLILGRWSSPYLPLRLGCVPCLKGVDIYSATLAYQEEPFKLSELLSGASCITTLTLDFLGQKIWLQPEKYQLRSAFSNLKELLLHGIFVGFGLLWTTALLEAAPSLETLDIKVYDHLCGDKDEEKQVYGERTNAPWDLPKSAHSSKSLPLKELKLSGFNATEEQIVFIGVVIERASNLQAVILKEQYCKACSAISPPVTSGKCRFLSDKDEQEMVVNSLKNLLSSGAKIIFSHHKL